MSSPLDSITRQNHGVRVRGRQALGALECNLGPPGLFSWLPPPAVGCVIFGESLRLGLCIWTMGSCPALLYSRWVWESSGRRG